MKNLINTLFVLLFATQAYGQDKKIETESVTIESLIPFVVENYGSVTKNQNITLLIETTSRNFSSEESILLKQALKYLSEQLKKDDTISILAYNAINGIALENTPATSTKKLLNVINGFSSNIHSKSEDGITQAYTYAEENYIENSINTLVMVRNPNGKKTNETQNIITENNLQSQTSKKQKSNMVLLTAIAVLPELISIIKD